MSGSTPEHTSFSVEAGNETFRSPAARLLRDFHLAFYFSQGESMHARLPPNAGLDFVLCFVGYEYYRTLPFEDPLFNNLPHTLAQIENKALRLGPPPNHEPITEEDRQLQVTDSWSVFKGILEGDATPYEHYGYLDYLKHMSLLMLARDQHYMLTGRPGRSEGQDPYLSHFREYVLFGEGQDLGSPVFESIFDAIRAGYQAQIANDKVSRIVLNMLRVKWENRHPGESFSK